MNADEIALDVITSVGSGIGRSDLETEHTLTHYRQSLWFAKLLDRGVWRDDRDEAHPDARLLNRAQAQFDEIMACYTRPKVDEGKLQGVREVVARVRRELVG